MFNGADTIQQCIYSISSQTYPHKELIIIDGASADSTVAILERNDQQIKYWESNKDRGIAHAWNKALEHVNGDWVLFLGADDRLLDDRVLLDIANILRKDNINDVIYGKIIFEGGANHGAVIGDAFNISKMKRRMIIPHTAAFHRRSFFDAVGKFDEIFKMAMDYEILLRKRTLAASFVDRHITVMGGNGISSKLIVNSFFESRKAQIKNKVDWFFIIEAWHIFFQLRHQFNLWRYKENNK